MKGIFCLIVVSVILQSFVAGQEKLTNRKIYSFLNRHDNQFLTAINLRVANPLVVVDTWRDASTQKWRVVKAYTATAYQFKPTSDEDRVMTLDPNAYKLLVSQGYPGLSLSNDQYWQVFVAGQGFVQLKNYKTEQCLQSLGMGKQVGVAACDNSFRQQWEMHAL